jgi:hypothetical protein
MRFHFRAAGSAIFLLGSLVACGGGDDGQPGGADAAADADTVDAAVDAPEQPFSFFITSLATMRLQSGSQDGFGGDLGGLTGGAPSSASTTTGPRSMRSIASATVPGTTAWAG